jgi:signal transduction histidine kinase
MKPPNQNLARACAFGVGSFLSWLALAMAPLPAPAEVLTNATQVRSLSPEEAAKHLPVRLQGVVIDESSRGGTGFTLIVAGEGIYVEGPESVVGGLRVRDLVAVEGTSDPGGFAPFVRAQHIRKLGRGEIPEPRPVTFEQLIVSRFDAQWIEVRGIVRSCEPVGSGIPRMAIELATGGERLAVRINRFLPAANYVDSEVRVRGICYNKHNSLRQLVNPVVNIPPGTDLFVEKPPPPDPYAVPAVSAASLLQFATEGSYGHRVRVQGIVTHQRRGECLWIRQSDRGLRIQTRVPNLAQPGDIVDVLGFPTRGGYTPMLEDATFRIVAATNAPPPVRLAETATVASHDADLIEIEAALQELRPVNHGNSRNLEMVLRWNDQKVEALLPLHQDQMADAHWLPGSQVRLTGICAVRMDEPGPVTGIFEPRSFQLLLRSAADLEILQAPPWWTPERIARALTGVAILLLAAVAAVLFTARRRLREQSHRRAMAEAEFSAILAERNRMAREIHDTLAQGLGAISMQLELAKSDPGTTNPTTVNHIELAHQLVRTSMAEARNSIWNMRSQVLETGDLPSALKAILEQMADGTGATTRMEVRGTPRRLSPVTENNLLRVGQEAITNAAKHARARSIAVKLDFDDKHVRLSVRDDGQGFDPRKPTPGNGGFGLVGMHERATQLQGELSVQSSPGQGTEIILTAPA